MPPADHSQTARGVLRVFSKTAATALYITFAAWAYSAALAGDMLTASVTLFLAWATGVAALAFSELLGAFEAVRRLQLNILFAVGLAALTTCLWFYDYARRPLILSEAVFAADPHMEPAKAEHLKDGSWDFPVKIKNLGKGSIKGYAFQFARATLETPLTSEQEEGLMARVEGDLRQNNFTPASLLDYGNSAAPGEIMQFRQPDPIDAVKYKQIFEGKRILYYAVAFLYADARTEKQKNYITRKCVSGGTPTARPL